MHRSLGYGLLGLIVVIVGYLVYAYNALVANKNLTAEGWSGIDVQLRRRADLIPIALRLEQGGPRGQGPLEDRRRRQ
jgi:LemA protein